jgi:hypothetical protein
VAQGEAFHGEKSEAGRRGRIKRTAAVRSIVTMTMLIPGRPSHRSKRIEEE